MNIVEELYRRAEPEAVALLAGGEQVTYRRLFDMAEAAAARLSRVKAARIGLDCPNGVAHVELALAIVRAGKCLVPIAAELAAPERERLLRETAVGAIVDSSGEIRELRDSPEPLFDEAQLAALNPAFIRFSSGTTGRSKGVVLSHERLLERVTAANRGLQITPEDRVVWILPMAHHFAVSIMLYLLQGAATIVVQSHLAASVLSDARKHGGTVVYGSPFHHALLAAEASGLPWPNLRLAVSTAAALPLATARSFDRRFGVPLSQGLGIIEVGLPLLNLVAAREKPLAVGRALPEYEARIEGGELLIRGPGMLDAYLFPWRTRDEVLVDGWFHTGDAATIDSDGDVCVEGRTRSVINVAGLKCFPEEIEAVLCQLPDVRMARVVGSPHARVGSVPVAEIVPRDPAQPPDIRKLEAHCRAALARYKVPVEFHFVVSLPLTASGKVKRASAQ